MQYTICNVNSNGDPFNEWWEEHTSSPDFDVEGLEEELPDHEDMDDRDDY